ncbi:MAG: ABC transporter ATP-binding protein, partial [Planctomycetota bacterium]
KTIIFVTHDVFEAVKMGDRIAILDQGELQQLGTPREIVEQPANEFVDDFLGQQRFQLSLLTQTVESMVEPAAAGQEAKGTRRGACLETSMPLLSALDAFKRHGRQRLQVYKDGRLVGHLTKDALLAKITEVMSTLERETDA